jgi:hypothetical protein
MNSKESTNETDATNLPKEPKMGFLSRVEFAVTRAAIDAANRIRGSRIKEKLADERGDVPGWVLVVLMTTGLVTAIWTIAAPRLTTILKESLDAMNGVR